MRFRSSTADSIHHEPHGDLVPLSGRKDRIRSGPPRWWLGNAVRLTILAVAMAMGAVAVFLVTSSSPHPKPPHPGAAPQVHVSGSELVSASGRQVVLHGVNRSGTEYQCVQGHGIFDGPSGQASITTMKNLGINAVRIPLNEACWNAQPYVKPAYAGAIYRAAIKRYVSLLNSNGLVAILDLHWTDGLYTGTASACSSAEAACQKPMPDAAQSIPFWRSVASTFKGNDAVIFDLFNEPYPERADNGNQAEAWQCWRGGKNCAGIAYRVAGMQALVSAVRSTGAIWLVQHEVVLQALKL